MDKLELKKQLLDFTQKSVEKFLEKHPNLEFYAFAYDCNAEYAEVNLCFNTKSDFEQALKHCLSGEYSKYYQTEKEIKELKYNPGDWEYQCFETKYVLTRDELTKIFNNLPEDNYKSWNIFLENLLDTFCECLLDFTKTETYKKIPKTSDFIAFCIDHDESFDKAMERYQKIKINYI